MNIVNFSIDNELLGARYLGTRPHKNLRATLHTAANTNTSTSVNASVCDLKELCNQNHFTSKLPRILKEREFDLTKTNLNKIFTAQWLDDRKVIMGTKCNKVDKYILFCFLIFSFFLSVEKVSLRCLSSEK